MQFHAFILTCSIKKEKNFFWNIDDDETLIYLEFDYVTNIVIIFDKNQCSSIKKKAVYWKNINNGLWDQPKICSFVRRKNKLIIKFRSNGILNYILFCRKNLSGYNNYIWIINKINRVLRFFVFFFYCSN